MNHKSQLHRILFLDIETVPLSNSFNDLKECDQVLFEKKTTYQRKNDLAAQEFYENAGIWAEFGKIICISAGFFTGYNKTLKFRLKSFYGDNEYQLLTDFKNLLEGSFNTKNHLLCAHNGKEFDFPYLARRMIINHMSLPGILNLFGKKPWQVQHLDTMEMWKFGDYKHYTSLDLLTSILKIPSPKNDISGNEVGRVYHLEKNLERIVRYCEKDTISVARIYMRFSQNEILIDDQVEIVH